ncbi:MAG: hypothetical protein ACXADL_03435 [Candidatus Thorarchaeota archaeon]|jgi:hypothetical protein
MKRTLQIIVVLGLVALFVATPVEAATSQGFEWGVALGSQFEYTLTGEEGGDIVNEAIYINVTDVPVLAIPDPLNTWSSIPDFDVGFWWANGTSMGLYTLIFIGLIAVGSKLVLPIGNWTHLQSLLASELTGETITPGANVWTVVWSEDTTATEEFRITASYAIADGFLAEYKLETWGSANNTLLDSFHVTRDVIPSGGVDIVQFLTDNILYVAIGIGIVVVLAIVCKKR